jgi:hypothetical protein
MEVGEMDNTAVGNMSALSTQDQDKKIEAMEQELQILKGSIKKLMIDIREEINSVENPFLNLQQLQAPIAKSEVKAMSVPASAMDDFFDEPICMPAEEPEKVDVEKTVSNIQKTFPAEKPQPKKAEVEAPKEIPVKDEIIMEEANPMEIEEPKMLLSQMKESMKVSEEKASQNGPRRLDPETIIKLMHWTRTVLLKNGTVRFYNLLDAYVSMGYLNADTKNTIEKMSRLVTPETDLSPKDMDIKECVGDMYTLFMILNPRDANLDSRMLGIMLGYEDRSLNIL